MKSYSEKYAKADSAFTWFRRNILLLFVSVAAFLAFSDRIIGGGKSPGLTDRTYSWGDLNEFVSFCGGIVISVVALIAFHRMMLHLSYLAADLGAVRRCFLVLEEVYWIIKGSGSILTLDDLAKKFSDELSSFAKVRWSSATPEQYERVSLHITAVQNELRIATQGVLRHGTDKLPEFARLHRDVLERLIDERWMSLLDIPDATEANSAFINSTNTQRDRRDAWIVILGAAVAALVIGLATAVGVPPAASVPAALIFLLGPATLWGGRRLGMGPRDFMGSLRGSFGPPPQDASTLSQPSSNGPAGSGST
ncbi:hypothetical protein [Streptomyces sp. NBC_01750]|uniref:hypothetical protein n=1 Tax=Streptomyces sp. NBC_01750 TaxID=2975928 RepID=UPI002DD97181|nr:hypothetical protein [Streptomyces sp. NBC_01750]WSD34389.1 hypothetical protein OG966_22385 [Streptomyces sp. NBC_01750]